MGNNEEKSSIIGEVLEIDERITETEGKIIKARKKLRGLKNLAIFEAIVFIITILISCFSGLSMRTVVDNFLFGTEEISKNNSAIITEDGIPDEPVVPVNGEDDIPNEPVIPANGKYSITVDRVDISCNAGISIEDLEGYQKIVSDASNNMGYMKSQASEAVEQFNNLTSTYAIKSSRNVLTETYEKTGNTVMVNDSVGLNGSIDTNNGDFNVFFAGDNAQAGEEYAYSDSVSGYLMWQLDQSETAKEEAPTYASIVFIYDADKIDTDSIAEAVVNNLNNYNVPIGANKLGVDINKYGVDAYYLAVELKDAVDSATGIDSTLYLATAYGSACNGYYEKASAEGVNRPVSIMRGDCVLTADNNIPNIQAVIVNIDSYCAGAELTCGGDYELSDNINTAISQGYHN